jgi:predicted RNase H-like HicB family nuclease
MMYDVILSKKENQYLARVKEWPEIMAYDNRRDEAIRQVQTQLLEFLTQQQVEVVQIEVPLPTQTNNL